MNGRGSYAFGGTAGQRFGASKRFGLLGNAVFDYNGRGIDNIQPALDPLSTMAMPFYDSNTIREYRYYRTRYGFDGSADYRFNNNTTHLRARLLFGPEGLGRQVVLLAGVIGDLWHCG